MLYGTHIEYMMDRPVTDSTLFIFQDIYLIILLIDCFLGINLLMHTYYNIYVY